MSRPINKTMDLADIESDKAMALIDELNSLIKTLKSKKLRISSWYGLFNLHGYISLIERINRGYDYKSIKGSVDDRNFPWFLYWEIAWVVLNNNLKSGQRLLDLGGSSSLFSYYLASKGLEVTTIDLRKKLVDNGNIVAGQMEWNLKNYVMDMRKLNFDSKFDHITSICVYEHIPLCDRLKTNKKIKDLLVENGRFSITFDYKNPSRFVKISSPKSVHEQFVRTSGLKIRGNKEFFDNSKNYLLNPFYYKKRLWLYKLASVLRGNFSLKEFFRIKEFNDYTFGALFLEKS